jgi:long-chain acyl-CoA synthetase
MSRLGDRLRRHARDSPDAPAVHDGERWWSFRALVDAAAGLGLEVAPGEVVAIAIDRGLEAVVAVVAAALAGAIPALIDPRDRGLATRTLHALRPAVVAVAEVDAELPGARVITPGRPAVISARAGWHPVRRAEPIAHLIFTSGSTANGKAVVWSELRAGFDWMIHRPRAAARERPAGIVVPLCTALGYHELAGALYHGTSVALLDAPFPAAIAIARALGVGRLKLTPTHVELWLATAEALPELRVAVIASAPIAPDRLRALAARIPRARIARSYGLTESGAATMVWLHQKPGKLHTVGRAIGLRRVTVRDPAGQVLPPGRTGEVVIDLPVWGAADGYLDAPPELARRFANATLWTGDEGMVDDHGFLVLGPRAAEILKVGGRSVGAPRIEEQLATVAGVAEVAVVGVPDRLLGEVPCAVFVPTTRADARRLIDGGLEADADADGGGEADGALRPDEVPRWFVARRELPRSASGKLRRGQLAHEAARWAQAFVATVVPEHRPYPAYDLEHGVAVVDGGPPEWLGDASLLDPCARIITLVARRPARPIALAVVQAGAPGVADAVRFVLGPIAVELPRGRVSDDLLDVLAGELIVLASALPGTPARRLYALPIAGRGGFAGAGFAAVAGDAAGWLVRGEPAELAAARDELAVVEAGGLAALGAIVGALAGWARRCASAPGHRAGVALDR